MKILYILNATAVYGGATKSFMPLLEGLRDKGLEVCVLTPDKEGIYKVLNRKGIKVVAVNMRASVYPSKVGIKGHLLYIPRIICRLFVNRLAMRKLKKIFKNQGIDIIHSNVSVMKLGFKLAAYLKVPHIYHIREYVGKNQYLQFFPSSRYFYRQLRQPDSYAVCITKGVMNYYGLANAENVRMIYDPVLTSEAGMMHNVKEDYFLYAGRIERPKGLLELIHAYAEYVRHSDCPAKLRIAGAVSDQAFYEEVKRTIEKNEISDYVSFLGELKDLTDTLRKALAIIVPSWFEGFGRCMAEAMFNGCLVIGKDNTGTKEQFDNGLELCGEEIGFRYQTTEELTAAMMEVERMGKEERKKIESYALKTVLHFYTNEASVNKVYDFYQFISQRHKQSILTESKKV